MKEFILKSTAGKEWRVALQKKGEGFEANVDGTVFHFSAEEVQRGRVRALHCDGQLLICTPRLQGALSLRPVMAENKNMAKSAAAPGQEQLSALFPGRVVKIHAAEKKDYAKGALLLTMESMKMEYDYRAPFDMAVKKVLVREGQILTKGEEFFAVEIGKN